MVKVRHINSYDVTTGKLATSGITLLLADRTDTQYDRLLASSCRPSVCNDVCIVALGVAELGVQG